MLQTRTQAIPILFLAIILLVSCDQKPEQIESNIIAKVGNAQISAEAFSRSYHAGPSILKNVDQPKQSYLDAMINEELLAADLKQVGSYDSNPRIIKALRLLNQELVVERMFKAEVHDQVEVSDEEIRLALEKSRLSVKADFIISQDMRLMIQYQQKLDSGLDFNSVQTTQVGDGNSQVIFDSTDYVRDGELPEPLNGQLFELQANAYSDIISIGNAYVIAHCRDRIQEIIDPKDYQKYHDRFYKVLDHRKRLASSRKFVKDFMDPLDIKVEGEIFAFMVNALYDLYVNLPIEQQTFATNQDPEYEITLGSILSEFDRRGAEIAVRSSQGDIPVKILLEQLLLKPFQVDGKSKQEFAGELSQEIGIALRDYYLEMEGIKRGFDQDPLILNELASWEKKLIVQAFIAQAKIEITPDDQEMQTHIQNQQLSHKPGEARWNQLQQRLVIQGCKEVLDDRIDSLRNKVQIEIFSAELSKLEFDNQGKTQGPETYFFKLGLPYLRSAFATPDPIWGYK